MWEGAGQGRSSVGRSRRRRKCQPLLDGRRRQAYICRHYTEMTGLYIYGPIKKESRKICPSHGKRPELTDRGQGRRQLPWFVAREWHHVCRFSLKFFFEGICVCCCGVGPAPPKCLGRRVREAIRLVHDVPAVRSVILSLAARRWQPVAGNHRCYIVWQHGFSNAKQGSSKRFLAP